MSPGTRDDLTLSRTCNERSGAIRYVLNGPLHRPCANHRTLCAMRSRGYALSGGLSETKPAVEG